jgi:hypothetical protein
VANLPTWYSPSSGEYEFPSVRKEVVLSNVICEFKRHPILDQASLQSPSESSQKNPSQFRDARIEWEEPHWRWQLICAACGRNDCFMSQNRKKDRMGVVPIPAVPTNRRISLERNSALSYAQSATIGFFISMTTVLSLLGLESDHTVTFSGSKELLQDGHWFDDLRNGTFDE